MAAYRRVYDSRHLQADYQEPGSAPEPYARQSSMGYLNLFTPTMMLVERNHAVMRSPYHCAVRSFAIRRDFYIAPRPPGDIVVGVGRKPDKRLRFSARPSAIY